MGVKYYLKRSYMQSRPIDGKSILGICPKVRAEDLIYHGNSKIKLFYYLVKSKIKYKDPYEYLIIEFRN